MSLSKPQLIFAGIAGVVMLIFVLIFIGILPGLQKKEDRPENVKAELMMWGVSDRADAYTPAIASFNGTYKNVTIRYRWFENDEEYESTLVDSLAAGRGPDIFMIPNTDLVRFADKSEPLSYATLPLAELRTRFPDVVENDFARNEGIYALPVSLDTLALIYNKSTLNENAIVFPPATWNEFEAASEKLVSRDTLGNTTKSGAALGAPNTRIPHGTHIIELLLVQNAVEGERPLSLRGDETEDAFTYYTRFEFPFPYAEDALAQGNVGMIFAYAEELQNIRNKNPFIKIGIAEAPQKPNTARKATYARYKGFAVSRQSAWKNLAWSFILEMTTNPNTADAYVKATGKPPALKSLINAYLNDPALGVFARQALIAESWNKIDSRAMDNVFSRAVEAVFQGRDINDALQETEREYERLRRRWENE